MEGRHPYQWEGVTRGGVSFWKPNAGQSLARKHDLRMILVMGPDLPFKFGIEVPIGARPVIFRRGTTGGGESRFTYFYGWERPGEVYAIEFGSGSPTVYRGRDVRFLQREEKESA